MGYTPRQVGEMSIWEFTACIAGYIKANNPDDNGGGLSSGEIDELSALLDRHKEIHGG